MAEPPTVSMNEMLVVNMVESLACIAIPLSEGEVGLGVDHTNSIFRAVAGCAVQ